MSTIYDSLLEKSKREAKDAAMRVKRIEGMQRRAAEMHGMSERYLRIHDNQDILDSDPVFELVTSAFCDIYPYSSVGRRAAYLSHEGAKAVDELADHARALQSQMWNRTMKEQTYNELSGGTHPIYKQARELGIEIMPGRKPRNLQQA